MTLSDKKEVANMISDAFTNYNSHHSVAGSGNTVHNGGSFLHIDARLITMFADLTLKNQHKVVDYMLKLNKKERKKNK